MIQLEEAGTVNPIKKGNINVRVSQDVGATLDEREGVCVLLLITLRGRFCTVNSATFNLLNKMPSMY